jgi:hypothetical protein
MKILDARVDWFEGYMNEPQLMLLVDRIPDVKEPWLRLLKVVDDEGEVRYVPIKITDFPRHGRIIKVELIR